MEQNKTGKYFKYAIGEIILVVIGILIALQINNWNEARKEKIQEKEVLQSLQLDFRADISEIETQLEYKRDMIAGFINCLEILTNNKKATLEEFSESFKTILQVGGVTLNATTFNNLQTIGDIRLIRNKALSDKIVKYYNTNLTGWESAFRDYARNTLAPYLMTFDYIPQTKLYNMQEEYYAIRTTNDTKTLPKKNLQDYKENIFIINALRQRLFNLEGLKLEYDELLKTAKSLDKDIQNYLMLND